MIEGARTPVIRSVASRVALVPPVGFWANKMESEEQMSIGIEEIREARQQWIDAVRARDVERVVALYDPERGRLLGTLDTAATTDRNSPARIREYFEHFLANDAIEPRFPTEIPAGTVTALGDDHAAYSGYYEFLLEKDGEKRVAHAKFTYIYGRGRDGLFIVTHNSGLTPEGIETI